MDKGKYIKIITLIILFLILCTPVLKFVLSPDFEEKKDLEMLRLSELDLEAYPTEIDSFFNENYGYRAEILNYTNRFKYSLFNRSHTEKVLIGQNGYLYYTSPEIRIDHRGGYQLNMDHLNKLKTRFDQLNASFSKNNITFGFTVAPNKQTIYPEHLPNRIKPTNRPTRLQQLKAYFEAQHVNYIIPLSNALLAQKGNNIYRKKDTHWTHKGAKIATEVIIAHLEEKPKTDFLLEKKETSGDLAKMMTMENELRDTIDFMFLKKSPYRIETEEERYFNENAPIKKSIVFYGDSFGMYLRDWYVENFESVVFIKNTEFDIDEAIKFQPDFVIYEVVERNIKQLYYDLYLR